MTRYRMKSYDELCNGCPYEKGKHLKGTRFFSSSHTPLKLESNSSSTLLVFQAPGEEEWQSGTAINPSTKRGGSAGKRILNSWERSGKERQDFDITNVIQCFSGKYLSGRDAKPSIVAICMCKQRLKNTIENGCYSKIITFGSFAKEIVDSLSLSVTVLNSKHPSGGVSNDELDNLW